MMKALRSHFNSKGQAKASFRNREEALAFITKKSADPDYTAYECPDCKRWHIGRGGKPQ